MVRGPAAVLVLAYGAALAYFALAGELPVIEDPDAAAIVSGGAALVALALCVLALVPLRRDLISVILLVLGAGLLAGALTAGEESAGANVAKAAFAGGAGLIFARVLGGPAVLVAVALFVGAIDIVSVATGPAANLIREQPAGIDFLTVSLPRWGGAGEAQLGLSDLLFLGFFASGAWTLDLRRELTAVALVASLLAGLVLNVTLDTAVPLLPGLALALLLPNADLLTRLVRERPDG